MPSRRRIVRSQRFAKTGSCVTNIRVDPNWSRRENNKSIIAVPFGPSRLPVGSSRAGFWAVQQLRGQVQHAVVHPLTAALDSGHDGGQAPQHPRPVALCETRRAPPPIPMELPHFQALSSLGSNEMIETQSPFDHVVTMQVDLRFAAIDRYLIRSLSQCWHALIHQEA